MIAPLSASSALHEASGDASFVPVLLPNFMNLMVGISRHLVGVYAEHVKRLFKIHELSEFFSRGSHFFLASSK
jgi:hypothetical protein